MFPLNNRLALALCAVAAFALLGWGVMHFARGEAVTARDADVATRAIAEAVVERKAATKADARVASENRVRLDAVRATTRKVPDEKHDQQSACVDGGAVDADRMRLLNDVIGAANAAIHASRSMPE